MRSKSVDNFFQRSNGESRPPSALITTPPPPPSPPPFSESPLAYERSPSQSPSASPNPSLSSHSPSVSPKLSMTSKIQPKSQAQPVKTHCFQEHVFRRPTSCQRCKHMIQGRSAVLVTSGYYTHGKYAAMLWYKEQKAVTNPWECDMWTPLKKKCSIHNTVCLSSCSHHLYHSRCCRALWPCVTCCWQEKNCQFLSLKTATCKSELLHFHAGNSKQGLRCKACKLAAHLWCSSELSQQPCNGKVRTLQTIIKFHYHAQCAFMKLTVTPYCPHKIYSNTKFLYKCLALVWRVFDPCRYVVIWC